MTLHENVARKEVSLTVPFKLVKHYFKEGTCVFCQNVLFLYHLLNFDLKWYLYSSILLVRYSTI